MPLISINSVSIDPHGEKKSVDAKNTNYIYLRGTAPLLAAQQQQLTDFGVEIHERVTPDVYLCRYQPSDLETLRRLDFVDAANCYHTAFKVPSNFQQTLSASSPDTRHAVHVMLHPHSDSINNLSQAALDMQGVEPLSVKVQSNGLLSLQASPAAIDQLKRHDCVRTISPDVPAALFNNIATVDMHASVYTRVSFPFKGSGQIISVNDSGFDIGSTVDVHPAFVNRVIAVRNISNGTSASDWIGHGTHVAGSILGKGISLSMGGTVDGVASEASLVSQCMMDVNGNFSPPATYEPILMGPYSMYMSRISSNSWGTPGGVQTDYTANPRAESLDAFVATRPDMVVVCAAGNDGQKSGRDPAQITDAAAAKNCITVGATYSSRPANGQYRYDPSQAGPSDPTQAAAFTSLGPTKESRTKPDVAAPGVAILSTATRDPNFSPETRHSFGISNDQLYYFNSGTSMAAPLVAGCCAVLRQMLIDCGRPTPSAALVKALLVNGSLATGETHDNWHGAQVSPTGATMPSNATGWGRVDLEHSIVIPGVNSAEGGLMDVQPGLLPTSPPQDVDFGPETLEGKAGVKATLVWTDPPGATIQNRLGLELWSTSSGQPTNWVQEATGYDANAPINNVQQIFFKNAAAASSLRLRVIPGTFTAVNGVMSTQSFALVWSFLK